MDICITLLMSDNGGKVTLISCMQIASLVNCTQATHINYKILPVVNDAYQLVVIYIHMQTQAKSALTISH